MNFENISQFDIFRGTRGSKTAEIIIVGEAYGSEEAKKQMPFVGESGKLLESFLSSANIPINKCFFTNVINERPFNNEMTRFFLTTSDARKQKILPVRGLFPSDKIIYSLELLKRQIEIIKPKLIIACGNYPLWALTENSFSIGNKQGFKIPTGITQWRGSQLRTRNELGSIPLLPIYHPAAVLRTFPWSYMVKHDLAVRAPYALSDNPSLWDEPNYDFTIRPNSTQCLAYLQRLLRGLQNGPVKLVCDIETRSGQIACIGFARNSTSALCIPFMCTEWEKGYWGWDEEFQIVKLIREIFSHPNLYLIGQNFLFDLQYLTSRMFTTPKLSFDTMIAHHVCWPGGGDPSSDKQSAQGIQQKALYNLSSLYCAHHRYWKDEGKNWEKSQAEDILWEYNCRDCVKTFEIHEELTSLIKSFKLQEQFNFQMEVANDMLLPMMLRGVKISMETKDEISQQLQTALQKFDRRLEPLIPDTIKAQLVSGKTKTPWYRSASQQKKLFFDILGIKPAVNKKTGKETTGKDALPIIAQREPILSSLVSKLELRRSVGVYFNTFLKAEVDDDDRMRCSYNITGTDTFRLSSSSNAFDKGTNLQNIPSGKEVEGDVLEVNPLDNEASASFEFPNVRRIFIPDDNYEIAEFDLSGADAQVVAWEADDDDLKKAFRSGVKIHIKNARDIFPDKTKDMTDEQLKQLDHQGGIYHNCKRAVHGTNYGASHKTLVEKLRWSEREALDFQERWFQLHPGIRQWHIRVGNYLSGVQCWNCNTFTTGERICKVCGSTVGRTVGNKFGFRIVYFDRPADLLTKGLAWAPQSTVGINANKGATAITRLVKTEKLPIQLLLQVHDSLIMQYPISDRDYLRQKIFDTLHTISVPYKDPLTIPWSAKFSTKSWGDAEGVKMKLSTINV